MLRSNKEVVPYNYIVMNYNKSVNEVENIISKSKEIAKISSPPQDNSMISYADICTIISSSVNIDDICANISQ